MRQWHVDPSLLCRRHLLGEHLEVHMFIGALRKGKSIKGFIEKGLVEVHTLVTRHGELVAEMLNRGYGHRSPIAEIDELLMYEAGSVDRAGNLLELKRRCESCRALIEVRESA